MNFPKFLTLLNETSKNLGIKELDSQELLLLQDVKSFDAIKSIDFDLIMNYLKNFLHTVN